MTFVDDLNPRLLTADGPWQGVPPPWKVIYHRYKARSGYDSRAGMLRVVGWMYLLKNYSLKDWVAFNEVFGMPLRLGKYDPGASTPADREALIRAVRNLGSDAAGMISKTTEIEFVEASYRLTGSANPYQMLAEFCNREMSKAMLGQTLTTDTAGSHRHLRRGPGPRPGAQGPDGGGRPVPGGNLAGAASPAPGGIQFRLGPACPWFRFKLEEEEDLKTLSEVYRNLKEIGVPLPGDQVAERFGVPLPRAGRCNLQKEATDAQKLGGPGPGPDLDGRLLPASRGIPEGAALPGHGAELLHAAAQ